MRADAVGYRELRGRESERLAIERSLLEGSGRLVTLTGRGGIGKTILARTVADGLAAKFAMERVVVRLEAIAEPALVVDAIVREIGLTGGPTSPLDAVATHLEGTRTVLVLDNFEHVLDAASDVAALLDRTTDLRILVTSQAPLRLAREHLVTLGPLPVPDVGADVAETVNSPAAALYCERVTAVDPAFRLDASNVNAVGELVRQLEGLPLAIELAAARAAVLPAAELLARSTASRFDVLATTAVDTPPRQTDLRAAISWTLELLTPTEQLLFRRLSVISGPFPLEAAEALCVDPSRVVDEMSTLVDIHLVDPVRTPSGARFVLPAAVRVHAAERLAATNQTDAAILAHVRASARWSRVPPVAESEAPGRLVEIAERYDDLANCLSEAMRFGAIDEALDLLSGLLTSWDAQGFHAGREQIAAPVLAAAGERGMRTRAYVIVKSWVPLLAVQHQLRPDVERQLAHLAEAETLARTTHDDEALLHVLSSWVLVGPFVDLVDRSVMAIAEGLPLARRLGAERLVSAFEVWAAMLAHVSGDNDRAVELGISALTRATDNRDHRNVVASTLVLHPLVHRYPELEYILPRPIAALELARQTGELVFAALLVHYVAEEALRRGDEQTATTYTLEGLAHGRSAPPVFACYALLSAIDLLAAWGDRERIAWLDGAMRSSHAMIDGTLAPSRLRHHQRQTEQTRAAIGTERYEAAATRGGLVPLEVACRAAESFVREHVERLPPPVVRPAPEQRESAHLTPRQREVLGLLSTGLTNREIADRLGLTPKTVMHHLAAVYLAIGARGRTEAIAWAFRSGQVG